MKWFSRICRNGMSTTGSVSIDYVEPVAVMSVQVVRKEKMLKWKKKH